jgi:hypothetical protein
MEVGVIVLVLKAKFDGYFKNQPPSLFIIRRCVLQTLRFLLSN